jgi:hypothetical protein
MLAYSSVLLCSIVSFTHAFIHGSPRGAALIHGRHNADMPGNNEPDEISIPTTATGGNATFRQLIDHNNPELGTFSQYYVWSNEFYVPGGPVILFTPGETDAIAGYKSYLHENRTTGRLAKEVGGAVVLIEHRYYGRSSPYADLTTDNMKYMTLDNAIVCF